MGMGSPILPWIQTPYVWCNENPIPMHVHTFMHDLILHIAYILLLPLRRHAVKTKVDKLDIKNNLNSFLLTARRNVCHKGLVQRWCIHGSFTHNHSHLPLSYITVSFRLCKQRNWQKLRSSPLAPFPSPRPLKKKRWARSAQSVHGPRKRHGAHSTKVPHFTCGQLSIPHGISPNGGCLFTQSHVVPP